MHAGAHGNGDLVAHFFRRAFSMVREDGTFGLIATNTIAQGDTRATGLRWIRQHGGDIYSVRKRVKWPTTMAAVIVSVVHVRKGRYIGQHVLDGRTVDIITAYLFHSGVDEDPARLTANAGRSFKGTLIYGQGFTFDDSQAEGLPSSLLEMRRLLADNPSNGEVVWPYIGGDEVNTSPTHVHRRYVINFGERGEDECRRRWPELMAIVEDRVKPERMTNNRGDPAPILVALRRDDAGAVRGDRQVGPCPCYLSAPADVGSRVPPVLSCVLTRPCRLFT